MIGHSAFNKKYAACSLPEARTISPVPEEIRATRAHCGCVAGDDGTHTLEHIRWQQDARDGSHPSRRRRQWVAYLRHHGRILATPTVPLRRRRPSVLNPEVLTILSSQSSSQLNKPE